MIAAMISPIQRANCDLVRSMKLEMISSTPMMSHTHPYVVRLSPKITVLQIFRQRAVVPERPDRIDDPHEPGKSEHGARKEEPAEALVFLVRTHFSAHIVLLWELSMGRYCRQEQRIARRKVDALARTRVADACRSASDSSSQPTAIGACIRPRGTHGGCPHCERTS